MNPTRNSLLSPRAIQNTRTRIYVPGSDPRFGQRITFPARPRIATGHETRGGTLAPQRLFAPGLLDRLQAPLTRYSE